MAIPNDDSSPLPSKTLELRVVSDRTGTYPELLHDTTVVSSTTAVVLESEFERGSAMRGSVIIRWDNAISAVSIEG